MQAHETFTISPSNAPTLHNLLLSQGKEFVKNTSYQTRGMFSLMIKKKKKRIYNTINENVICENVVCFKIMRF